MVQGYSVGMILIVFLRINVSAGAEVHLTVGVFA
jgi:hypothetical protein